MKRVSLRIDQELLWKVHRIAEYEKRSVNKQIGIFIRDYLRDYEAEHGEIVVLETLKTERRKKAE